MVIGKVAMNFLRIQQSNCNYYKVVWLSIDYPPIRPNDIFVDLSNRDLYSSGGTLVGI